MFNDIPSHIALIMDGNGRWAEKRKLPRATGHNEGGKAMKKIVKKANSMGIKYLTVYAFSTENWKREKEEIDAIFKILILFIKKELKEIHEKNVKIQILGDYKKLPKNAVISLEKALEKTRNNTGLEFNIALNYGSRDEIRKAVTEIAEKVKEGKLNIEDITEEEIEKYFYTGAYYSNIPDPELIIRTSGEQRLSNYLMWQSAYSELVFTEVLWPDFTPEEFEKCIEIFKGRKRRYGGR